MAYIPERNTFVIEIAKSGSRTLFKAALNGRAHLAAQGHHKISTAFQRAKHKPNPTVIAVIRDPVERFVSAVNFHFSRKDHPKLDSALELVLKNGVTFNSVFDTQSSFLDDPGEPHVLKLYPLERMTEALASIGCTKPLHENKRPYAWGADEIKAHPLFDHCMAAYEIDAALRDKMGGKLLTIAKG